MEKSLLVLLVEDDDDDAILARRALEHSDLLDARLLRATRLGDLDTVAEHEPPDLILLDLTLPDSTGLDTLVHARTLFERTPIIVLTGIDDARLGIEALRAGGEDYVRKGTADMSRLARTVRYALERRFFRERKPEAEIYRRSTGLPGRTIFLDRLTMAMRRADHAGGRLRLAWVRCKAVDTVSDRFGPQLTEVFQRAVLKRLMLAIDLTDTVADLGGGEYACIFESALAAKDLYRLSETMAAAFREPVTVSGTSGIIELSPLPTLLSITSYPADGRTLPVLVSRAVSNLAPVTPG